MHKKGAGEESKKLYQGRKGGKEKKREEADGRAGPGRKGDETMQTINNTNNEEGEIVSGQREKEKKTNK